MDSKRRAEKEFDQLVESKRDNLQQQEKAIQSEEKLFHETLMFCSNIFRCGSNIEILSMKKEIRARLSKLESSNITGICKVELIATPVIQFCNDKRWFELLSGMEEKIYEKAKEQTNVVVPPNSEARDDVSKKLQEIPERVPEMFSAKDDIEPKKPKYTSVA